MATRYSDVRRGAELNKALTNYAAYLQNASTRPSKRLQGGTVERTIAKQNVAVRPFSLDNDTAKPKVLVKATEQGLSTTGGLAAKLSTRIDVTLGTDFRIEGGFTPAKVSYFKPTSNTRTYVASKITKLYYIKYAGSTFSIPFGALTDAEEFETAKALVKADVLELDPTLNYRRVSITNERVRA